MVHYFLFSLMVISLIGVTIFAIYQWRKEYHLKPIEVVKIVWRKYKIMFPFILIFIFDDFIKESIDKFIHLLKKVL